MTARLVAAAKRIRGWLEFIRLKVQPDMDRWLSSWKTDPDLPEQDFVADADYYIVQQEPLRARILIRSLAVVFLIFTMWAALAQIDEITRGEGKVVPSQQLQVLQSLDGGIVSEIKVREGQIVNPGDLLLRIDATRFVSSVRESQSQYYSLLAKAARQRALTEGTPFIPPPETLKEDPQTVEEEKRLYETATSNLNAQLSIARQQLAQRQQELAESRARREQASQAYELTLRELTVTKPLFKTAASPLKLKFSQRWIASAALTVEGRPTFRNEMSRPSRLKSGVFQSTSGALVAGRRRPRKCPGSRSGASTPPSRALNTGGRRNRGGLERSPCRKRRTRPPWPGVLAGSS